MVEARRSPSKDKTDIRGSHCLIVEARFYDDIQDALLAATLAELDAVGVTHDVVTVPGCLEIPSATAIAIEAAERAGRPYDAVVALGCVIRGETIHFEIVSMESARGLMDISIAKKLPLGNGIITANTEEQAWVRAKADQHNKGGDAARAAISMMRIKRRLQPRLDQLIKDRQRNVKTR